MQSSSSTPPGKPSTNDVQWGDCFWVDYRNVTPLKYDHLWIVISYPDKEPDAVVVVNLTSSIKFDEACVLGPEHHSALTKKSYTYYAGAQIVSNAMIIKWLDKGWVSSRSPMSPDTMELILQGAENSEHITGNVSDILRRQGVIDS